MVRLTAVMIAVMSLVAAPFLAARPTAPPSGPNRPAERVRLDLNGEPLPAGAMARLGAFRFRHKWTVDQPIVADISSIAFAPDGRTVYSANPADKWARACTVADGREIQRYGGDAGVWSVAVSSDGKTVATGEEGNLIRLWDAATGKVVGRIDAPHVDVAALNSSLPNCARPLRFRPDGKSIVALHLQSGSVVVWDMSTGKERSQLTPDGGATDIDLSGDGRRLVVGTNKGRVADWDLASRQALNTFTIPPDEANAGNDQIGPTVALSPDGKTLVTSCGFEVRFWDTDSEKEVHRHETPAFVSAMAMSPTGKALAIAYHHYVEQGVVSLLDTSTGKELRRLDGMVAGTISLAFSRDGKMLATGGTGLLRIWDVATGKEIVPAAGHPGPLTTIAVSADGKQVVTCSDHDRIVRLWDTATGREVCRLEGHTAGVDEVTLSPDGKLLASAAGGQQVFIWDLAKGRRLHKLDDHAALGAYMRFSDDSKTLATGNKASAVALWDCTTGKPIRELTSPPRGLASLLTFNNGRLLALESPDREDESDTAIRLWDVAANRLVRRFSGHEGMVNSAILSADGRMLASRGSDKTIRVWEVASGEERCRFTEPGPTQITGQWTGTQFLTFSPDCRLLVTCASDDPFARRWDLTTGKELPPLAGHRAWVGAVEFSANGRVLVTGSQDTTALVWDMASREREPPAFGRARERTELLRIWDDLADRDAAKAYQAILALTGAGDQTVAFLGEQLKATLPADPAKIVAWIAALDDPQFAVRERSTAALLQVADQADEALRKALERTQSAEVRHRIRRILDAAGDVNPSQDRLREVRAVEALERIATPAAREQLANLSRGAPALSLTREARSSLKRLQ